MNFRPIARAVLFVVLVAGATRREFIMALAPSWRQGRAQGPSDGLSDRPLRLRQDPVSSEFVRFLQEVQEQTPPGSRIAIIGPAEWHGTHNWYVEHRVHYLLAGRLAVVVPKRDSPLLEHADYLAAWRPAWAIPAWPVALRSYGGVLLRRGAR
jgi:hypothetical protein